MHTFAVKSKENRSAATTSSMPAHRKNSVDHVLSLSRIVGNRAVASLLSADAETTREVHGRPLSEGTRSAMESRFGEALDDVRIHSGPTAHRLADMLRARALTVGHDIVLGAQATRADIDNPRNPLLAHELTHLLQHRRAGMHGDPASIAPAGSAPEREAHRNGLLAAHGLPLGPTKAASAAVGLTPTSENVEYDLSYALDDWAVTEEEENRILDALERDPNLSATVTDLRAGGMLGLLFDRIDAPGSRLRLLHILGQKLSAAARTLVEPHVRKLGNAAELQFNLGRAGVTAGAPAFNPAPLQAALVGKARTSTTGFNGGFLTSPFSGVGATGVIPVTRYVGTF